MMLPGIMALVLIGTVVYYLILNQQSKALLKEIKVLEARLEEARGTLRALEEWERVRGSGLIWTLARWVPLFGDPLEARLRLEGRILELLREAKAAEPWVEWKASIEEKGTAQVRMRARGVFPSYQAVVNWTKELEQGSPPMIPVSMEIRKEGMRLRVSADLKVFFRVEHGSL